MQACGDVGRVERVDRANIVEQEEIVLAEIEEFGIFTVLKLRGECSRSE